MKGTRDMVILLCGNWKPFFLENRDPIRKICRNLEPISLVFGCRVDLLHQLTLSPERERGNVEQDPGNEVAAA